MPTLPRDGYAILHGAVPPTRVRAALRLIGLTVRRDGLTADQIREWQHATFYPHLRDHPAIEDLLPPMAHDVTGYTDGDTWAEPQILIRYPDEAQPWQPEPHVDEPPPWADGRRYKGIIGVALTDTTEEDGPLYVWPGTHTGQWSKPVPVPVRAGDAVLMDPQLQHSGSLNLGHTTRVAVYFRLLGSR